MTDHPFASYLALLDAFADEARETLLAIREASGDPAERRDLDSLLKEYVCLRDRRPLEDALIYDLDPEALDLRLPALAIDAIGADQ